MSSEKIKILININKNVLKKNWKCMHPNCDHDAINSHLLQKSKILNKISENSHIIELVENNYFKIAEGENNLIFKRNSLNKVMSHPLFCNSHDTSLFRKIEVGEIDYYDTESQSLFSYRALCSELWKKQRNLEFYNRMKNSHILKNQFTNVEKINLQKFIDNHTLAVSDLMNYKSRFEGSNCEPTFFTFKTFKIPKFDICGSGMFSPISKTESLNQENPLPAIFINLIPMDNSSYIIIGKSKEYSSDWIEEYFKSWELNYISNSGLLISDLIACRIESWAISPSLFEKWKSHKLKILEDYWNRNMYNMSSKQNFKPNLFSD